MTLYILRVGFTPRDSRVIGYFTSKAKLIKAMKKNASALGLDDCEGFQCACRDFFGEFKESMLDINEYLENGSVEEVQVNAELE